MRGPKVELELQKYSDTTDSMGGYSRKWYGARKIKGVLTGLSMDERVGADKETVYATHRFFCSVPPALSISSKDRFVISKGGQRIFDIKTVNDPTGQGRGLEIELLEVT